jgi:hypothetical protein
VPRELRAIDNGDLVKIRELEKLVRTLRVEKDEAIKDKVDALERLKLQDKELKDALGQRKLGDYDYLILVHISYFIIQFNMYNLVRNQIHHLNWIYIYIFFYTNANIY